ncbi:MAG: hypothetical protein H7840_15695 [Alphaproteobacteria bacterium]
MFGFAKKARVPKRWVETARTGAYARAVELGVAREKKDWPYHLLIMDEARQNVVWHAPSYQLSGNVLVTLELDVRDESPETAAIYKAFMEALQRLGRWSLPLSRFTWLLGTEVPLTELHHEIANTVGIHHTSFTVIGLMDGRGIGWDASTGVLIDISPLPPSAFPNKT